MSRVLSALLEPAAARLANVSEAPRTEAERLLAAALATTRTRIQAGLAPAPTAEQSSQFLAYVQRRVQGEPFAYIVGEQPFRNLSLKVTPAVLIPRPETELLVDWALEVLADSYSAHPGVWDVCTGSGCIALAIASEWPRARVWASDASAAALAVARENARCQSAHTVQFGLADWLAWDAPPAKLELIVANPPYIAAADPHLPALVHEPLMALASGVDGLDGLTRLIQDAPARLAPGGWLLLEHGYDQGQAVRELLTTAGFSEVQTRRDYGGQERMSGGRWPA